MFGQGLGESRDIESGEIAIKEWKGLDFCAQAGFPGEIVILPHQVARQGDITRIKKEIADHSQAVGQGIGDHRIRGRMTAQTRGLFTLLLGPGSPQIGFAIAG